MAQEFNFKPVAPEAPAPSFNFRPVKPTIAEPDTPKTAVASAVDMATRAYNQFGDIAAGVNAGIVGIPQGIAETAAIGIDYGLGTNTARQVSDGFNWFKGKMGFTPDTTAGKAAETATNFAAVAIPLAGWLSRGSTAARIQSGTASAAEIANFVPGTSRLARSAENFGRSRVGQELLKTRKRQAGTTTMAMGASDFLVAPDGVNTLADAFDALPDVLETETDTGLEGRAESARRFRNKARHWAEGAGLNAAFELAFPVIGGTAKALASVPGVSTVAGIVGNGFDALIKGFEMVPGFKKYLTFSGNTPQAIKESITEGQAMEQGLTDAAAKTFTRFEQELKNVVNGQNFFGKGRNPNLPTGKEGIKRGHADLMRFLEGETQALDAYGPKVVKAGQTMRDQIDQLTDDLAKQLENSKYIDEDQKLKLLAEFEENKGKYIRRVYDDALDPEKVITAGTKESAIYKSAIQEVAGVLRSQDIEKVQAGTLQAARSRQELEEAAEVIVRNRVYGAETDFGLDPIQAAKVIKRQMKEGKAQMRKDVPLFNVAENMLRDRLDIYEKAPSLQKLKGVKDDPREVYLQTVGDMSRLLAANNLYTDIARLGVGFDDAVQAINRGAEPLVISGENLSKGQVKELTALGYKQLSQFDKNSAFGGKYGALSGSFVKPALQDALTLPDRLSGSIMMDTWATLLQAKGISQMSKTVLSPLAVVRNGLSGIFMLGANGNVPRNTELWDSMRLTIGKLTDLDEAEFLKFHDRMGRLGIRDQNLVVNEFQRLLREGSEQKYMGAELGAQKYINKVPGIRMFQDIYSGTDTFWKIAGVMGERGKFSSALQKAGINPELVPNEVKAALIQSGVARRATGLEGALDDIPFIDILASDIVKGTMPVYSRVPKAIRGIQRIPVFGNFVAFPAEILRNSINIVQQGTKELAFKATPELIESLGREAARNSGAQVTPELIEQLGTKAARRFEREIRAIGAKRLMGYTAMATVLPQAIQETSLALTGATQEELDALHRVVAPYIKGHTLFYLEKPKDGKAEFLDFSYMNPYDYAVDPARQALRVYNEKGELTDSEVSKIFGALKAGLGSFFEPFGSESLVAERVQDVTTRNGRTSMGAIVYRDSHDDFEKISRSLKHISGGFNPGLVDQMYTVRGGQFVPGRTLRAIMDDPEGQRMPSKQGITTTPQEEALTLMTGFRRMDLDLPNQLVFLGSDYSKLRNSAKGEFTNAVGANDITKEQLLDVYRSANTDLLRVQGQLYQVIEAARTLGMKEEDIIRNLKKDSKLGNKEIAAALTNRFDPIVPTANQAEKIFYEMEVKGQPRVLTEFPIDELFEIYEEFEGRPIALEEAPGRFNGFAPSPDITPQPAPQQQFNFKPAPQQQSRQFNFKPQASAPGPAPSQSSNEVSSILVPNPVTSATFGG